MPVDGLDAAVRKNRDLGTSRWRLSNHTTSCACATEVPLRSAIGHEADIAGRLVCQKCKKAGKRPAATLLQLAPRSRQPPPPPEN